MLMELPQHTYPNQMNKLVAEVVVDFIKQQATIAPVLEQRMVDVGRRDP
jgi:hypothetical protein